MTRCLYEGVCALAGEKVESERMEKSEGREKESMGEGEFLVGEIQSGPHEQNRPMASLWSVLSEGRERLWVDL